MGFPASYIADLAEKCPDLPVIPSCAPFTKTVSVAPRPKRFRLPLDQNGFGCPSTKTVSVPDHDRQNGFGAFQHFQRFPESWRTCPTTCPTHLSHLLFQRLQGFRAQMGQVGQVNGYIESSGNPKITGIRVVATVRGRRTRKTGVRARERGVYIGNYLSHLSHPGVKH